MIVVVLASFVAVVDWLSVAEAKLAVATHDAVTLQVPVPLIMVTNAVAGLTPETAPTEQIPAVPVIVGATPELVVAVTVKLEL